jgi:hypothetical protein
MVFKCQPEKVTFLRCFYFLMGLVFELGALHLESKCSNTYFEVVGLGLFAWAGLELRSSQP